MMMCTMDKKLILKNISSVGTGFLLLALAGCGKHEQRASTLGTVSGALVGASVAGKRDTATGMVIGGLVGNLVGSAMGRSADDDKRAQDDEMRNRIHARRLARERERAEEVEAENRSLRQAAYTKWCFDCRKKSTIAGARCCTGCGGDLVTELSCPRCDRAFSPDSGYNCCPYCRGGIALHAR